MTDETGTGIDDNNVEIDEEHPWVEASLVGSPQPVSVNINLQPVVLQDSEKNFGRAALMSIVSPVGVFNFYLNPVVLQHVMESGTEIIQWWIEEEEKKRAGQLIVADKGMERSAVMSAQQAEMFRKGGR